ncbi:MAG: hypothetical protein QXT45_04355 [Candidatus Bilamarchaeaceae archaeon]
MINVFFALKVDGIPDWLSGYPILSIPRFDDPELFFDDQDLFFDTRKPILNNRTYVSTEGSTRTLSQSINPDKDGSSSTTSITFRIVDFKQYFRPYLTKRLSDDLLGREARVFAVKNIDSFPEDSTPVLFGYVEDISLESGSITLTVYSVLNYLRSNILPTWKSNLTQNFEYESLTIQGLRYFSRNPGVFDIYIEYIISSAPISVSVTSPNSGSRQITVTFPTGTTAGQIRRAISDNQQAQVLVEVKDIDSSVVQTSQSPTILGKTKFVAVEDVSGLVVSHMPEFETFININDEILKVLSIDPTNKTIEIDETTRGLFNSFRGVTANEGDTVSSFYVLRGDPIDLFLRLVLSRQQNKPIPVTAYGVVTGIGIIQNAVEIATDDVYRDYGIVVGDVCSLGSIFSNRRVMFVGKTRQLKSYIIVDGPDIGIDATYTGSLVFNSQFDTLPIGAGSPSYLVDVKRFIEIRENIIAQLPYMEFYVKDDFNLKEFSERELFFPSQLFLCPRNGKISVSVQRPFGFDDLPSIDSRVFIEPERVVVNRSLNEFYYNTISLYYDRDSIDDEFLSVVHTIDTDSVQIYRKNILPLIIESLGIRSQLVSSFFLKRMPKLLLERYRFGAIHFELSLTITDGLQFQIGDVVLFNGSDLYFPSFEDEDYTLGVGYYQIINRELMEDRVKIRLVSTQFRNDVRYTTFAPSSEILEQIDSKTLRIANSFGYNKFESEKWSRYLDERIIIHDFDRQFVHLNRIASVEQPDTIVLYDVLPTLPNTTLWIEPADYDGPTGYNRLFKTMHPSWSKKSEITGVINSTTFTVPAADSVAFYEGVTVIIHDSSFTIFEQRRVTSVSSNTIEIDSALSVPLTSGLLIDVLGFYTDKGPVYVWG